MVSPQVSIAVMGLDVGTSGVRALAATTTGEVVAEAHAVLDDRRTKGFIHEQDPREWWHAASQTLRRLFSHLKEEHCSTHVSGIAVTSTSGSLVLADTHGNLLRLAILYDDTRGSSIAEDLNRQLAPEAAHYNASYSLVKAGWIRQEEPAIWERASRLLHPTDWLTGRLTGCFEICDYSNALKLGYDAEIGGWGRATSIMNIPAQMLPRVVRPGTHVGTVSAQAAAETGLVPGTPVLAGATDGIASLIASGAREAEDANTTLGTTIVWKVLASKKPHIGEGMYCHRHPADLWAPGAASNTGPGSLRCDGTAFPPVEMDRLAAEHLPSPHVCYILPAKGERFPFLNSEAVTFFEGNASNPLESYAARLQSLAFVERWGYERLGELGVTVGKMIYSTGSAAGSPVLSQVRADVLKRQVARCQHPASAFGAAILAATGTTYCGDLKAAMSGMINVRETFPPCPNAGQEYDRIYSIFRSACARRGYV